MIKNLSASTNQFNPFMFARYLCLCPEHVSGYDMFMKTCGGNYGNSYITYSIIKHLYGEREGKIANIEGICDVNPIEYADYVNSGQFSHVILNLTDIIREKHSYGHKIPWRNLADSYKQIKIPLVIFSLGSNSFNGFDPDLHKKIDKDLIYFLQVISSKTISLGIRGHYTAEILTKLRINNFDVVGCPSFYEMGENRTIIKAPLSQDDKILFTSPNIKQEGINFNCVLQDEEEFPQGIVKNWQTPHDKLLRCKVNGKYVLRKNILEMLLKERAKVFSDILSWKNFAAQHKFAIGSRMHGGILALNCNIPAIITNGDARAKEMCEFFHIPLFPKWGTDKKVTFNELNDLYASADYSDMNKNYPILYKNFQKWLSKNGLNKNDMKYSNVDMVNPPQIEICVSALKENLLTFLYHIIELEKILSNCKKFIPRPLGLFISCFILKTEARKRFRKTYVKNC